MAHYVQFFVVTAGKYNGKEYKAGDEYPFNPDLLSDLQAFDRRRLRAAVVKPSKSAEAKKDK